MRLGDLDALADKVRESMYDNPHTDSLVRRTHIHEHDCFLRTISLAPTIDAVPVVRCKDCKHCDSAHDCTHPENIHHYYDVEGNEYESFRMVDPDHFCSYGERKDGGE